MDLEILFKYIDASQLQPEGVNKSLSEKLAQTAKQTLNPEESKAWLSDFPVSYSNVVLSDEDCANLLLVAEKTRESGLEVLWFKAFERFPLNITICRLAMRWYRRLKEIDTGLQQLYQANPENQSNSVHANNMILGLVELQLWANIDELALKYLEQHKEDQKIRNRYMIVLHKQARYKEMLNVASEGRQTEELSPSMQKLLQDAEENQENSNELIKVDSAALRDIARILQSKPVKAFDKSSKQEKVCFFTGQLGSGGAERQLTRIAAEFRKREHFNGKILPYVCVRHATPKLKSDFFLPVLTDAQVPVYQLNDHETPDISRFTDDKEVLKIWKTVEPNLGKSILCLAAVLVEEKTDVIYAWQDSAVLIGVVAALLAGVPRIISNFRGMAPILRPELLRAEMKQLFPELPNIRGVAFTANSLLAAKTYTDWLKFDIERFTIIPNALDDFTVKPLSPPESEQETWDRIEKASPDCTHTVIGVYRYDDNKRPLFWVDVAAKYVAEHPLTRFIIVGRGKLEQQVKSYIKELGMENRIFQAGVSEHVPFWLSKADLLMHLAKMEGLPNAIIESQISGTPVLATPAGGVPELIEDGVTGYLLNDNIDPCKDHVFEVLKNALSCDISLKTIATQARECSSVRHEVNRVLHSNYELLTKGSIS
tara:strand:- start:4308 stop:6272 length:1965 start_codon:yes stop_codon:yes gene_type:complete